MTIPETYDYLMRARRDLWAALRGAPDAVLSQPLLSGERFHSIKDLVAHIAMTEDFWLHEDILRETSLLESIPALYDTGGGPVFANVQLETLLDYWQAVEQDTLGYLTNLSHEELNRVMTPHDDLSRHYLVKDLLWHVMLHEVRHTAQIAMLLRLQGIRPPSLDLLFYLPNEITDEP
jgi:uncharacterized damage-inducible protein DinB